jgi:hypothetical protein
MWKGPIGHPPHHLPFPSFLEQNPSDPLLGNLRIKACSNEEFLNFFLFVAFSILVEPFLDLTVILYELVSVGSYSSFSLVVSSISLATASAFEGLQLFMFNPMFGHC